LQTAEKLAAEYGVSPATVKRTPEKKIRESRRNVLDTQHTPGYNTEHGVKHNLY